MIGSTSFRLHLRSQSLGQDAQGRNQWYVSTIDRVVSAAETAILLCDMWDMHWSRGASERVDAMAPQMNEVVRIARSMGAAIIHAPSDTMECYENAPARRRMLAVPVVEPPAPMEHPDPPLPVDASDQGSDTGETSPYKAWSCEHPALEIDQGSDYISDSGSEVYSLLQQRGIRQLLIMGVHTNMCVLGRSFGIKQMVRWGVEMALVRDLTDTMYNPARPPYVSHDEGTRLVVAFIEKFWCPTVASSDLMGLDSG